MTIDIVYTYVNGNDISWQKKKAEQEKLLLGIETCANDESRFMDNQELKYSLRSVDKFAKWVNNIFIVTDNQVPEWLNVLNPKINIVDHKEIFSDTNALPCFNAKAIETQIHHIKNLSERFIYFNDDMFLGKPTTQDTFFRKDGDPNIFVSEIYPFPSSKAYRFDIRKSTRKNDYQESVINTRILYRNKYNRTVYYNIRHGVKPLFKSVLNNLEDIFSEEINHTRNNKFRSGQDLMMFHLCQFYCLDKKIGFPVYLKSAGNTGLLKKFLPSFGNNNKFGFINLENKKLDNFLDEIRKEKPLIFCLNQTPATPENNLRLMKNFLDDYFPDKSEFEN